MKHQLFVKSDKIIHINAYCMDCSMRFDSMHTGREDARKHAEKTGHSVNGETGYAWSYSSKPFTKTGL